MHLQSWAAPDDHPAVGVVVEPLEIGGLDELQSLWTSLVVHHTELQGEVPFRAAEDSWPRVLAVYRDILQEMDGFCLVARRERRAVAYAIVKVEEPEYVWKTGPLAELETLSVADSERGTGVGSLLMDAVEHELARRGIDDLIVAVEVLNDGALRFYERRGYRTTFTWLYGKPFSWHKENEGLAGDGI